LDIEAARKIIEDNVSRQSAFFSNAQKGFDYYENKDDITYTGAAAIDEVNAYLKKKGSDPLHSADNRISINRHKIAVDQKIGYMFTDPPQFDVIQGQSDDTTLKKVQSTIGDDWTKVIKQLGIDASNTGRGWLHYWYENNSAPFEYWYINPMQIVPVYDNRTAKKKLRYLIRYYQFYDDQGNSKMRYELWDDKEVAYLERLSAAGSHIEYETFPIGSLNPMPHTYGRIPFIEFQNNARATSDLTLYKPLVDAMDKLISGFANDNDDIQEIIYILSGYSGDASTDDYDVNGVAIHKDIGLLQKLKAEKLVRVDKNKVTGEDGGLDALRNEIPYAARSAFFEILDKQFWVAAMAVNPSTDNAGNQSGTYIDFLYGLLEHKAGLMETEFRTAINEFLKSVLTYLGAKDMQFNQTWKRTKPQNNTEVSAIIAQTPNTVMSDETKTKVHPLIEDWQEEREKIVEEQAQRDQNTLDLLNQPQGNPPDNNPKNPPQPNSNDGGGNA